MRQPPVIYTRKCKEALQMQRYQIFKDPLYQKEIAPLDAAVNGR